MNLRFRPAGLDDADQLLRWRNHPTCRSQSLMSDVIDFETHLGWLTQALINPRLFICVAEFNNQPIGYIRATREGDDRVFLSWLVAPEYQGQGLGKQLISTLCDVTTCHLFARIKAANTASIKAAQFAGFIRVAAKADHDLWEFTPKTIVAEPGETIASVISTSRLIALDTQQLVDSLNGLSGPLSLFH